MPIHFDIKPRLNLLHVTVSARATGRQFLRRLRSWTAHPDFHAGLDVLYDVAGNAKIHMDEDGVLDEITQVMHAARQAETHRVAGVVRGTEHETFFHAAVAMFKPEAEAEAFYQFPEALSWLGTPEAGIRLRRFAETSQQDQRERATSGAGGDGP
jgi:hypothetical protein